MSDAVKERVMKESKEGKIPCAKALALAKELGVTPAEVGKAANETKVKVVSCQLGCFDQAADFHEGVCIATATTRWE